MCCSTVSQITSGIEPTVHYIPSLARCDLSEISSWLLCPFWIHWLVFRKINLWEKWSSCLRAYGFRLGVPAFSFNGIPIGHVFLAFPGVQLAHTLVFPFPRPLGERALSLFLGFSWASPVGLKCVLVRLMSSCSSEKLQGEVHQTVHQLIPHSISPRAPVGNRHLKSKGAPGPLHSECFYLSTIYERLSSFIVFLLMF